MADQTDAVAKAFCDHYYTTFDTNRQQLATLYQNNSLCTFESEKLQGQQRIVEKLGSLPFRECKHQIDTMDAQPSPAGGIIVFVTGKLLTEGQSNPLKFSQMFHLSPVGGSFVVTNDVFRLNYG